MIDKVRKFYILLNIVQVSEGNILGRAEFASEHLILSDDSSNSTLLRVIAEQLKLPLMHIARQAEFYRSEETLNIESLKQMQLNADMAIKLVDSYILGLDMATKQLGLELEPISLSSTLYDIAHDLTPIARQHNCDIELLIAGKYGQVMAHKTGLIAAMYNIGVVLADLDKSENNNHKIRIAAHRSSGGIVAGMYLDQSVSMPKLALAKTNYGNFRQPFSDVLAQNGAGVFVADTILEAMNARLKIGRFRGYQGLAVTLQPNKQLRLV